ncbi:cryptococcal mannosyltransferase 1-domain-containing protein [Radiomyces spectabilis]|uniref:cryptococcal mannosyltransferase 1-domain-containing protein n=1 Tax=Radiomyces spectabilis TaxID=64574 RepID=UPI002220C89A|nr:cryptococcal mannosyltransferase 1-domain-containing protein [Radiomyces spectabilis]KAI8381191.1 cryptococcal mannosyltransferase 1-domain-containing protein [Radiomyces spectabilis]
MNVSASNKDTIFIAANLFNSEDILPHWIAEVNQLINWIGPQKVYISIYENGSTDGTKAMLRDFDSQLEKDHVPHWIVVDAAAKTKQRRIPVLANLRNRALWPIGNITTTHFDKIVFLNDIIFTAKDVITLLDTNQGNYDAACGMDFFGEFYDLFATRDIHGHWLGSGNYPYFVDKTSQQLLRNNRPIPVYSCWNGMAVFDAKPFVEHRVAFRALLPEEPDPPLEASECCLIFKDLRDVKPDLRVLINPSVKVAYDRFHYWYSRHILSWYQPFYSLLNKPNIPTILEEPTWKNKVKQAFDAHVDPSDEPCFWTG